MGIIFPKHGRIPRFSVQSAIATRVFSNVHIHCRLARTHVRGSSIPEKAMSMFRDSHTFPSRFGDIALAVVLGTCLAFGATLPPTAAADSSGESAEVAASTAAAAHPAAAEGWLAEIPLSSELSGTPLVSGSLDDSAGKPVAAGNPVVLWGWPSNDVLAAMADGDSVHLTPLGKALTTTGGGFALRVGDDSVAERLADDGGVVNLEVQAWSPEGVASYSFSSDIAPGGELLADAIADVASVKLATDKIADPTLFPGDVTAVFNKTDVCGATKKATYPDIDTVVGRMYSTTKGIHSFFSLRAGAETTIGVGVSVNGYYGSFEQSGTSTVTLDDTFTWGKRALNGGRQFRTDFTYGKFAHWCYPVTAPSQKRIYKYSVKPIRWDGGGSYGTETSPAVGSGNCRPFAGGTEQERRTSRATTTMTGAKLENIIGINLSSQVGYTSDAIARIYNDGSVQRRICGTNGVPTSPGRYLAQN